MKLPLGLFIFSFNLALISCGTIWNASHFEGFDIISLNEIRTNFRNIDFNWHQPQSGIMYVTGENMWQVHTTPNFYLDYDSEFPFQYSYLDVEVFSNINGELCAVGPVHYDPDEHTSSYGYSLPITLEVKTNSGVRSVTWPLSIGYSMYSVAVDGHDPNKMMGYFVGWTHTDSTGGRDIHLSVVRVHIDTDDLTNDPFKFNETLDVVNLSTNAYTAYSALYRPWIHYSHNTSQLIVVDPNTRRIWKIHLPSDPTRPMEVDPSSTQVPVSISSIAYNYAQHILYLGHHGMDFSMTGSIAALYLDTMQFGHQLVLAANESDPRAMVMHNGFLYVGLRGGPYILKIDPNIPKIVGYARLPWYLYQVESGSAVGDYIYFVTMESHGKIFRVHMNDGFCETPCTSMGSFCHANKCQCMDGFVMKDGACHSEQRVVTDKEVVVDKGAAIALGILFPIAVLAALAGWFMWYRVRKNVYQPV